MIRKYVDLWLAEMRKPDTIKHTCELESFHNANAMCCLGHACKALKEPLDLQYSREDDAVYVEDLGYELPDDVANVLGITTMGSIEEEKKAKLEKWIKDKFNPDSLSSTHNLVEINDYSSLTIEQIADIVEYCYDNDFFMRTT